MLIGMICSGLTHLVLAEEDLEVLVAVALDSCETFEICALFKCQGLF